MAKYKLIDFINESHPSNDQWLDAFQDALGFKTYMSSDYLISQYGDMKPEDAARKFTDDATKSAMAKDKEKFSRETGLEEDTVEEGEFKFRPTETDAPGMQARPDGYLKEKNSTGISQKAKEKARAALSVHLASAKEEGDKDAEKEVLDARDKIMKASSHTEVASILDDFGYDEDEIAKIIGSKVEESLDYQHLMKVRAGIIK
jgi:hypothetical protein